MKTLLALSLLVLGASQAMAAPPKPVAQKSMAQKPAPLKPEELTTVELKEQMPPHWVLVVGPVARLMHYGYEYVLLASHCVR